MHTRPSDSDTEYRISWKTVIILLALFISILIGEWFFPF